MSDRVMSLGGPSASPLSEKSDEYRRVLYLLQMGARDYALSEVFIWHLGSTHLSGNFEKRTNSMLTIPAWVNTRNLNENNSLDSIQHRGFSFSQNMTFSTGNLSIDLNQGTAHRFLLCQVGVGRSFVVDDPTEQPNIPEGYDSLYLALSNESDAENYRHEYSISDSAQALPMYLVQFFVDPDGRDSNLNYGAGRSDMSLPAENMYDRYDFFDPILYIPVSVRDKMVGSHSTGEYAQHKLIGISDAFDSAVAESVKPDPKLLSRRNEINEQLREIDIKLRQVSDNAAKVEEEIYKALQEALFQLQDITQEKMSALLSEEVELRRQLQQVDWAESFLDFQRDNASQLEFLNSWKCHVQLRADLIRMPLSTPQILESITSDLELKGEVYVEEASQMSIIPQQQQQFQQQPAQYTYPQTNGYTKPRRESHHSIKDIPASQHSFDESPSEPMEEFVLPRMNENITAPVPEQVPSPRRRFSSLEPINDPSLEAIKKLTTISTTTPARFASYSLKAEATRRLRQSEYDIHESLEIAEQAFSESKLLEHVNIEEAKREIKDLEREDEEESESEAEEETESHTGPLQRLSRGRSLIGKKRNKNSTKQRGDPIVPKLFSGAQTLLFSIPWQHGQIPQCELLYATWKPGTVRSVEAILKSIPKVFSDEISDDPNAERNVAAAQYEDVATIMVIKANDRVFGGYADEPWREDGQAFGRNKCFLFSSTLDIKIPFHGRKVLDPPPRPEEEDEYFEMEPQYKYCVLKSSPSELQFGVRDLILRDKLTACSSDLEYSFGVGLRPGSDDAATLLAGSQAFGIQELELWACR